jgi:hypothetical protein
VLPLLTPPAITFHVGLVFAQRAELLGRTRDLANAEKWSPCTLCPAWYQNRRM